MSNESLEYAIAYAAARSCLIALARRSPEATGVTFEELLFGLDDLHNVRGTASYPVVAGQDDLLVWLESAVRRMIAAGGDVDALELILMVARSV